MPICSKCGKDNPDDARECANCGAGLSGAEPTAKSSQPAGDKLARLATFHTLSEAEMAQELLETNGISSVLHGETDPIGAKSGAEPITLMVEKQSLQNAMELYEAFFAGDAVVQEDSPSSEGD